MQSVQKPIKNMPHSQRFICLPTEFDCKTKYNSNNEQKKNKNTNNIRQRKYLANKFFSTFLLLLKLFSVFRVCVCASVVFFCFRCSKGKNFDRLMPWTLLTATVSIFTIDQRELKKKHSRRFNRVHHCEILFWCISKKGRVFSVLLLCESRFFTTHMNFGVFAAPFSNVLVWFIWM